MVITPDAIHLKTGETYVSPFLLVYGTLRLGKSNYKKFLTTSKHIGTYELPGWKLSGILSGHTGNPKDVIVVDAFNLGQNPDGMVKTALELYELNYQLDQLEGVMRGGYSTSLIQLNITPTEEPAAFKLYNGHLNTKGKKGFIRDFASPEKYLPYEQLNPIPWL